MHNHIYAFTGPILLTSHPTMRFFTSNPFPVSSGCIFTIRRSRGGVAWKVRIWCRFLEPETARRRTCVRNWHNEIMKNVSDGAGTRTAPPANQPTPSTWLGLARTVSRAAPRGSSSGSLVYYYLLPDERVRLRICQFSGDLQQRSVGFLPNRKCNILSDSSK